MNVLTAMNNQMYVGHFGGATRERLVFALLLHHGRILGQRLYPNRDRGGNESMCE